MAVLIAPASARGADAAKSLVVTKGDVGSGYTGSTTVASPNAFGRLATCVGKPALDRIVVADEQGSEFNNTATGAVVFSSAQVVKSRSMAKVDRAILSNSKFPNCVAQILSQGVAAAAHLSEIRARRVSVKHFGDYSTAVLVEGSGQTADGLPISVTQIEVGIAKGRAEVSAGFTTHGSVPFDRRTAEQILAKVSARLDRAPVS